MFKYKNCENDVVQLMENNLISKKSNINNIQKAIDKVSEACEILDKHKLISTSNLLLELLANLK